MGYRYIKSVSKIKRSIMNSNNNKKQVSIIKENLESKSELEVFFGLDNLSVKAIVKGGRIIKSDNKEGVKYLINLTNVNVSFNGVEKKINHIHLEVDKSTYTDFKKSLEILSIKENVNGEIYKSASRIISFEAIVEEYSKKIHKNLVKEMKKECVNTYMLKNLNKIMFN